MGVYIEAFIDNNLYEKDLFYTAEKLAKLLNKKVYVYNLAKEYPPSDENDLLLISFYFDEEFDEGTYEEHIKNETYIQISVYDKNYKLIDIAMSKSSIQFYGFGWKWYAFEAYLQSETDMFDDKLKEIKHFGKLFNSTEMIVFGDDYYELEIEDKLLAGEYIKDIIKNDEFNIVSEIPVKDDKTPHIYYTQFINPEPFDLTEWVSHFPIIKNEEYLASFNKDEE